MQVKIDTKEKFTVVLPLETSIYDNMAAKLAATCSNYLQKEIKNVVLNLQEVNNIDSQTAITIVKLQEEFYTNNASFVVCEIKPAVAKTFEELELDDILNATPTESEAWDIVQMDEIERELLGDEE
jgi:anti-anti-sigma factor